MPSRSSLVACLLAAGLAVVAAVTAPASASMLDVDGGTLHHWVEPGPEPSETPDEVSGGAHPGVSDRPSEHGGDAAGQPEAPGDDSVPVPPRLQPEVPANDVPADATDSDLAAYDDPVQ